MSAEQVRRLALGVLLPGFEGTHASGVPGWLRQLVAEGLAGVTVFGRNIVAPDQVENLAALTTQLRTGRADLLVAIDEEGGDVTRLDAATGSWFPGPGTLGRIDDVAATTQCHTMLAERLAAAGVNLNFAPVADLASEPDSPIVGTRAFSPDPAVAARHVVASMRGHLAARVAPVVKHFPGHGDTTDDSHLVVPRITAPLTTLRARELVPFVAAIEAGAPAIMTGHLLVEALDPEQPATLSPAIITRLLREGLGFSGVVVTDGLDMHAISRGVGRPEAVVRALLAGVDLMCIGGDSVSHAVVEEILAAVVAAVGSGRLPLARLAEAAQRVAGLASRFRVRPAAPPARGHDREALVALARRALRLIGDPVPELLGPVLELQNQPSIVAGRVEFGLGTHLRRIASAAHSVRLTAGDPLPAISGEELVVCVRDSHLNPWQARAVAQLRAANPDLIVVDHGATAAPEVLGRRAIVAPDSSAAASAAVARVLLNSSMAVLR
ncbi:glycoside hydrolase family 3 protein [Tessaracoccus terricola]